MDSRLRGKDERWQDYVDSRLRGNDGRWQDHMDSRLRGNDERRERRENEKALTYRGSGFA